MPVFSVKSLAIGVDQLLVLRVVDDELVAVVAAAGQRRRRQDGDEGKHENAGDSEHDRAFTREEGVTIVRTALP